MFIELHEVPYILENIIITGTENVNKSNLKNHNDSQPINNQINRISDNNNYSLRVKDCLKKFYYE